MAASGGYTDVVQLLLERHPNVNAVDKVTTDRQHFVLNTYAVKSCELLKHSKGLVLTEVRIGGRGVRYGGVILGTCESFFSFESNLESNRPSDSFSNRIFESNRLMRQSVET